MFEVVEPEGLDLQPFQVLEVFSRHARPRFGLPGAVRLDPSFVERGCFGHYRGPSDARLLAPAQLVQALAGCGLHPDRPLLISGPGSWGPVNAARVAWALIEVGFVVSWLNGGSLAWSGPLERPRRPKPGPSWEAPSSRLSVARGDWKEAVLLDVRSYEEFNGRRQDRYRFFRSCGHIPGARWFGNWTELVRPDRRLRSRAELMPLWRGLSPADLLVFYCGTGWRSSLACCLSLWLGFKNVRNYDGGIYDWAEG